MIYISNPIYATVWETKPSENGKYIDMRITTSEKIDDGEFENSTWFIRVIGHALNSLKNVKRKERITITKAKLTNLSHKKDDGETRSYFKFLVTEASVNGVKEENKQEKNATKEPAAEEPTENKKKDDLPW